jgi:hypothetical protein
VLLQRTGEIVCELPGVEQGIADVDTAPDDHAVEAPADDLGEAVAVEVEGGEVVAAVVVVAAEVHADGGGVVVVEVGASGHEGPQPVFVAVGGPLDAGESDDLVTSVSGEIAYAPRDGVVDEDLEQGAALRVGRDVAEELSGHGDVDEAILAEVVHGGLEPGGQGCSDLIEGYGAAAGPCDVDEEGVAVGVAGDGDDALVGGVRRSDVDGVVQSRAAAAGAEGGVLGVPGVVDGAGVEERTVGNDRSTDGVGEDDVEGSVVVGVDVAEGDGAGRGDVGIEAQVAFRHGGVEGAEVQAVSVPDVADAVVVEVACVGEWAAVNIKEL